MLDTVIFPANIVLSFLSLTTWVCKVNKKIIRNHRASNEKEWKRKCNMVLDAEGKYIEHQNKLDFIQYGCQNDWMSHVLLKGNALTGKENSCEVIGVYNCLCYLNNSAKNDKINYESDMKNNNGRSIIKNENSFPYLLSYFEKNGIALGGYFGTSPYALWNFFKKKGYRLSMLKGKKIKETALSMWEKDEIYPGAYIFITYNDKKSIWGMIHAMCITKEEKGFVIHNDYEGSKCYPTLSEAVFGYRNGMGSPIMIMKVTANEVDDKCK
ncbi:MAG: hypothetical protein ACI4F4_11505 [Lachnospiraceae bacterium]